MPPGRYSYLFLFQSGGEFLRTIQALFAALYFVFKAFLLSGRFISALKNEQTGARGKFSPPSILRQLFISRRAQQAGCEAVSEFSMLRPRHVSLSLGTSHLTTMFS